MLMAQENGKLILAVGAVRNGKYYCPQCGQLVILKNGKNRRPYFAHLPKAVKLEAESVYHKTGKQRLYNDMLKIKYSVQMEVVMNNKAQRADIYISNKALALEYQCSAISLKSVANRTLEYNNSGIKVWWILGDNYLNRRLTLATLQKFVRYKPECGFYLVFYSVRQSRYLLWSHIEEANGIFIYQVNRYQSLQECWRDWDDIQQIKPKLKLRKQEVSREAHRLQVNVMLKNQQYLELADLCYRCGYILTGAPIICHSISHRFYPIFLRSGFEFRLRMLLKLTDNWGNYLSNSDLNRIYQEVLQQSQIEFAQINGIQQFYLIEFRRFFRDFHKEGNVKYTNNGIKLISAPTWYQDYDHKRLVIEKI